MADISDFGSMALQDVFGAEMARSLGSHYDTLFQNIGLGVGRGDAGNVPGGVFVNVLGDEILVQRLMVGPPMLAKELKRRTKTVANKYMKPEIQARIPIRKNTSHFKSSRRLKRKGERATYGSRGTKNALSGKLRKSVGISTQLEAVTIWIGGKNLFYGPIIDKGTVKRGGNPRYTSRFKGFNFVERGIGAAWPRYENAMRAEVDSFLAWMTQQTGNFGAFGKQGSIGDFAKDTFRMVGESRGSFSSMGLEAQAASMF